MILKINTQAMVLKDNIPNSSSDLKFPREGSRTKDAERAFLSERYQTNDPERNDPSERFEAKDPPNSQPVC